MSGAAELARKHGRWLVNINWSIAAFNLVVVFDLPDDTSFTAMALEIDTLGTVRKATLRAFNEDQVRRIAAKVS